MVFLISPREGMSVLLLHCSSNPPYLLPLSPPYHFFSTSTSSSASTSTSTSIAIARSPAFINSLTPIATRFSPVIHSLHSRNGSQHIESEWNPDDLLSTALKSLSGWGLPLALGAMIGSFLSCKLFIFSLSFSFLASVAVVKVLDGKGKPFSSIIHGQLSRLPVILLGIVQFRVFRFVPSLTVSFNNVSSKAATCIRDFQDFLGACLRTALFAKQTQTGIKPRSSESVFSYIEKPFVRMKSLIEEEEMNAQELDPIRLDELRETVDQLRKSLEDMLLTARKQKIEKSLTASIKNHKSTGKDNYISVNEIDGKHEYSEISVSRGIGQSPDLLLTVPAASTVDNNQGVALHSNPQKEVSVHTSSFNGDNKCDDNNDSKQVQLKRNVLMPDTSKTDENSISSRYPDYWLCDDAQPSMTMFDAGTAKQNKHTTITTTYNEDLYENRQNFWLDDSQNREKYSCSEDVSKLMENTETTKPVGRQWCREGQPDKLCLSLPEADDNKKRGEVNLGKQQKDENMEQLSSKGNMEANKFKPRQSRKSVTKGNGFNVPALDLMEELPFIRESPTMPATTERKASEYQNLMNEGKILFYDGKAGLNGKKEIGEAEKLLYRAADIFSSAAVIEPSSIEATGFWGNTHLVHGKLLLRLSRELRLVISSSDTISPYQVKRQMVATQEAKKWVILEEKLQVIGKECEEHFIQAGRKYRQVLTMHNRNIPALYNWGLALFMRAQIVAAEQDAGQVADRIYMAAIDKFEAMMGISQKYVPEATLNWGLALRARSRLRPMNDPERVSLLSQAKQLLEDALRLQHYDAQLYGTIAACNIELEELQRKQIESKKTARVIVGG